MPSRLSPPALPAVVIAALAGRSVKAVRHALADGRLVSFATGDVERYLGRVISEIAYLQAERSVDVVRAANRAYMRARKQRTACW